VTVDSVEMREERCVEGEGRSRKAANHRKLPDIPDSRCCCFLGEAQSSISPRLKW